jgi:hypothetical protein
MKKHLVLLPVLALIASTLACSLGNARATTPPPPEPLVFPTDTPPPPPPSDTPAPTFEGLPVSFAGTSFVIPDGLANGTANEIVPESSGTDVPVWGVAPAYSKFTLQGYPLQDKFFQPQIFVYPAQEFAQMHEGAAATISNLHILLADPQKPLPAQLPFLPPFNAAQVFTAQPQILQFQNGSGIRYLTQFAQYPATANNHDLFYTFQGLTSDGATYVTAILPVNAAFLAPDEKPDSPVPPDGIPLDQNNLEQYYASVVEKLNATAPDAFTPSLGQLDLLMQSVRATGQQ